MKYLKITLLQEPGGRLIYPDKYQAEIGDFAKDHLYYDEADVPMLLLLIDDKDFIASMIRDRVVEITEADAKAISEAKEQRTEKILDEAKLRRLEIKSRLGMVLTTEEIDSIDPQKPNSIFGMEKILADRIDELKNK